MNLDEAQKKTVGSWVAEGLKLADIQKRLATELGVNMTYMEVRLLVDDLRLTPKDIDPPKTLEVGRGALPSPAGGPPGTSGAAPASVAREPAPTPGGVAVKVDQIARPGTVVSGSVRFSDGNSAEWYLDQTGRLGMMPQTQGYRPSQQDVTAFQAELQNELAKLGF